jgi:putative transcriptional regulator
MAENGSSTLESDYDAVLVALARALPAPPPPESLRAELLDLAQAPSLPIDTAAYAWEEPYPGLRIVLLKSDATRGFKAQLVWGAPGARFPRHRHGGDEAALVLQGAYCDEAGRVGPGEVSRRARGSEHSIEILPEGDCFTYLVSYGDSEIL